MQRDIAIRINLSNRTGRNILTGILKRIKECGFGSVNHAKAVFRKRFGMTMRDWRRNQRAAVMRFMVSGS